MSKRTRNPPANPLAYFKHAQHFFASDLCLMHPSQPQEVKDFTIWGAVVMSALASELLLKCLAALEAGHVRHTHDLKALFDNLSPKTRAQIEREWEDISALKRLLERFVTTTRTNWHYECATKFAAGGLNMEARDEGRTMQPLSASASKTRGTKGVVRHQRALLREVPIPSAAQP